MSTCTAPGHPGCTITCPNGCGAVYVEPDGPCHTFCSGTEADLSGLEGKSFSIQISDLPASELGTTFSSLRFADETTKSTRKITLSEQNVTLDTLTDLLERSAK